jgi:hypothetical protein
MLKVNQTDRINLSGQELNISVSQILGSQRHLTAFYIYLLPASPPGIMVAGDRGFQRIMVTGISGKDGVAYYQNITFNRSA